VLYGGILIASGHFTMAVPTLATFYLGLFLIVIGTGLLKGNVSVIVGYLYTPEDNRRDAGFSIFYMGINMGAFFAPLVCGYLGQNVNWHLGFASAGVGMVFGLIQYVAGARFLGEAGMRPAPAESPEAAATLRRRAVLIGSILVAGIVLFALGSLAGVVPITATQVADAAGYFLLFLTLGFFGWLFSAGGWTPQERHRLYAIAALFLAAGIFWSVFEQAGSTLNLFADRNTYNVLLGLPFPSSWFQSMNSLFLWMLAPVFAWLWIRLGAVGKEPSSPAKFAWSLIFVAAGFVILIIPARQSGQVSPMWLTMTYLLHTIGELLLSPVGLSAMTKLAPARIAGLVMGIWFLATSVGNYIGGRVSGLYESFALPSLFAAVAAFGVIAGVVMFGLTPSIKKMMGGVN
jgi:POT family proton-dependent oligopeptide transporter